MFLGTSVLYVLLIRSVLLKDFNKNIFLDLMVQRCVIIQKDEKGYGLTVSGDNPVFVQSVKEGDVFYNLIIKKTSVKCSKFIFF